MSYIDVKEVNLLDESGQVINPAQDASLLTTNTALYGGITATQQITDWARTAYNTGIRANITFS